MKISQVFLSPLSYLWGKVYEIRRMLYHWQIFERYEVGVPVISVGNLSFGGTGKTPFVIWLSQFLNDHDKKVLILTRGYKGKLEKKSGLLESRERFKSDASLFGDEPLLISYKVKNGAVVIGKKRYENLVTYFDQVQPDVVILDDGFQHLKIKRDLDLVLIDSSLPIEKFKTAPLGYLREGLKALQFADIVLFNRAKLVKDESKKKLENHLLTSMRQAQKKAYFDYAFEGFYNFNHQEVPLEEVRKQGGYGVTGIANGQSFFSLVKNLSVELKKETRFPDHYHFEDKKISEILDFCDQENIYLICTEKDMVKIRRAINSPRLIYVKVKVEFISGEDIVKEKVMKVCDIS